MRVSAGQKLMLAIMVVAVNLVFIYASGMFGYVGYALLVFSSVATYTLTCEGLYGTAMFAYVAAGAIGLLIAPDKLTPIAYLALLGHYPIFKSYVDGKSFSKGSALCIRLLYLNVWLIAALCFVLFILNLSLPTNLPIPIWLTVIVAEGCFMLIDFVHGALRRLYIEKFRSGIVPKR